MHFDPNEHSGTEYFWTAMKLYLTTFNPVIIVMLIGYIGLLVYFAVKGDKKERTFYLVSLGVFLVVCYNPWVAWILVDKFGFATRYFRLFWIIPLAMGYSYFGIKLYDKIKSEKKTVVAIVLTFGLLAFSYQQVYVKSKFPDIYTGATENNGLVPIPNIYRVEEDTMEACRIIEEDSGDPQAVKMAVYNRDVFIEIRTYDAAILPMFPYAVINPVNLKDAVEQENWNAALGDLFAVKFGGTKKSYVTSDRIYKIAMNSDCEYIILPKDHKLYKKFTKKLPIIGEAGRYTVLKTK